jgi:hypothetical protein
LLSRSAFLKLSGAALLLLGSTAPYAQSVEPVVQLPEKKAQKQLASNQKIKPSSGLKGIVDAQIDGDSSGGTSTTPVGLSAVASISPLGLSAKVTPGVTLPLSAWTKVECNITTKYFRTITGDQPNDDVIKTVPSLSISNNAISFVCPYKSSAHLLNIAKSVDSMLYVSVAHSQGGVNYSDYGSFAYGCTRATKATAVLTCQ